MVYHYCYIVKLICLVIVFSNCILHPFNEIFIKNGKNQGIAIFSTGHPSQKVVKELHRAVAANPEEEGVSTDPNID